MFAIVLGEIGDKTQILALILAARFRRPVPIILAIIFATLANHGLACLAGQWFRALLDPQVLRWVLGFSFLGVAAWAIKPDKVEENPKTHGAYGVFMITLVTFFLAEMGDKTQIVAMALAAKYSSLLAVLDGTTVGMTLVNVPTVLFADNALKWVPLKLIRFIAAGIYALLGIITLLGIHIPIG